MEFTLFYRGSLKSNGRPKDKQKLRNEFAPQLFHAMQSSPAFMYRPSPMEVLDVRFSDDVEAKAELLWRTDRRLIRFARSVKKHDFVALAGPKLANDKVSLVELDILWLRPGRPGDLFCGGGDLDNRMKTLFDALTIPTEGQVESVLKSEEPELLADSPMVCLMDDDKLISSCKVQTAQLLDVDEGEKDEVVLIIKTTVHDTRLDGLL